MTLISYWKCLRFLLPDENKQKNDLQSLHVILLCYYGEGSSIHSICIISDHLISACEYFTETLHSHAMQMWQNRFLCLPQVFIHKAYKGNLSCMRRLFEREQHWTTLNENNTGYLQEQLIQMICTLISLCCFFLYGRTSHGDRKVLERLNSHVTAKQFPPPHPAPCNLFITHKHTLCPMF